MIRNILTKRFHSIYGKKIINSIDIRLNYITFFLFDILNQGQLSPIRSNFNSIKSFSFHIVDLFVEFIAVV